jgi:carboxyl-terminal processing protease
MVAAGAQTAGDLTDAQRAEDFAALCRFVEREYAYFDVKRVDWKRACSAYAGDAAKATTRDAYIAVLERALGELYDHHAHLGTNTRQSPRLVPSQSDVAAAWVTGQAIIVAVRADSAAERAGLQRGMQVTAIDGESIDAVVDRLVPAQLTKPDAAARAWALHVALAGRHEKSAIRLTIRADGRTQDFQYAPAYPMAASLLTSKRSGEIGYVRINNSLGEEGLVAEFDRALTDLRGVRALVLDLRDTPSGGNTTVARGIMSRFVEKPMPYQRHEAIAEFRDTGIRRTWVEEVAPRGSPVRLPLIVLVGPWTGSMGEGLAIGLNAVHGAPVLGETMARLLGALGQTELPHSKIVVRIPTERLAHVNGTPREAFVPRPVPRSSQSQRDEELDAAIAMASKLSVDKSAAYPVPRRPHDAGRPR